MIAVVFRKITIDRMKAQGLQMKLRKRSRNRSAAALGFISAIGAIGGFFIPKAFGTSLDDGFTCWGNENLRSVLYRLRSDPLGWSMDVNTINNNDNYTQCERANAHWESI